MDEVLDQAIVFHGFADYMRDYDVYIYATADPRTGVAPEHVRYRFVHAAEVVAASAVAPDVWQRSLDDRLIEYETGVDLDGYVWCVKWQALYPGMRMADTSAAADRWSRTLGIPFFEASVETNGHNLTIVFADLIVEPIASGTAPFIVPGEGPDAKVPRP
jgi:hypothetical protein